MTIPSIQMSKINVWLVNIYFHCRWKIVFLRCMPNEAALPIKSKKSISFYIYFDVYWIDNLGRVWLIYFVYTLSFIKICFLKIWRLQQYSTSCKFRVFISTNWWHSHTKYFYVHCIHWVARDSRLCLTCHWLNPATMPS